MYIYTYVYECKLCLNGYINIYIYIHGIHGFLQLYNGISRCRYIHVSI